MHQQTAAVDVAQEVVTESRAVARALDDARMSAMTKDVPSVTYTTPRLGKSVVKW